VPLRGPCGAPARGARAALTLSGRRILACTRAADLCEFTTRNVNALTAVNLVTALHRLAKMQEGRPLAPPEPSAPGRAALALEVRDAVALLSEHVASKVHELDSRGVSNCLWALAVLPEAPRREALLAALAARGVDKLPQGTPQSLSVTAWALGTMRWHPGSALLSVLSASAAAAAHRFSAQGTANFLWGLAQLGAAPPARLLAALSGQACRVADTFKTQELSSLFWAVAKLGGTVDPAFLRAAARRAAQLEPELTRPAEVAGLLWALATMRAERAAPPPPPELLSVLLRCAAALAPRLDAQGAASIAWSLSKLLPKILVRNESWAGASAAPPAPAPAAPGTDERVAAGLRDALLERLRLVAGDLKPMEVSMVLVAFANASALPPAPLAAALHARALAAVPAMQPQEVANVLWALAHLGAAPPPALLAALQARAAATCAGFLPQHVFNTLWALSVLIVPPPPPLEVAADAKSGLPWDPALLEGLAEGARAALAPGGARAPGGLDVATLVDRQRIAQLQQFFVCLELDLPPGARAPPAMRALRAQLGAACREEFAALDASPSRLQSQVPSPPPSPRTKWTRRVPHPVLIGHAASLTPY